MGLMHKFEQEIQFFPSYYFFNQKHRYYFPETCSTIAYMWYFVQKHCELGNFIGISTLLRPPFPQELRRVGCLILQPFRFQIKFF